MRAIMMGGEEDEKTIKFPFFSIILRLRTTFGLWPLFFLPKERGEISLSRENRETASV